MLETFRMSPLAPVDLSDFESLTIAAQLQNTTSGVARDKSAQFTVHEIAPHELTIDVPTKFCAQGHHLLLELLLTIPRTPKRDAQKLSFKSTARVKQIEVTPPEAAPPANMNEVRDRITTELLQFDEKSWETVVNAFENRQIQINDFLADANGTAGSF